MSSKDGFPLPSGWRVGSMEQIAKIIMGQSPPGNTYNTLGEGVPMLNGPTEFTSKYPVPVQFTIKPTKRSKAGDILFCVRGSSTGRMNLSDQAYCIGRGLAAIRAKSVANTNFIYYILLNLTEEVLRKARDMGSTFPNVSGKELRTKSIMIPPLPEQKKIAEILSTVDEKIEVIEEQIMQTQELKKGLMQRLLTQGIGHSTFKDSPLGRIPESWVVTKLDNLVTKVGSGITPKGGRESYQNEGVIFIRSQNVLKGKLNLSDVAFISEEQHDKMSNSSLSIGDVLLNITGASIGRSCIVPTFLKKGNVNQHVCIIRPNEKLDPDFLCQFLNSSFGSNQIDRFQAGGNREGLNYQQIRAFNLPFPGLQEQQKIASILTKIDNKLDLLEEKKQYHQELKKGLMQKLLTGKIRVKQPEEKQMELWGS